MFNKKPEATEKIVEKIVCVCPTRLDKSTGIEARILENKKQLKEIQEDCLHPRIQTYFGYGAEQSHCRDCGKQLK